ncbi:MAG TPA: ATP-dependent sacrificial sulfur transferase LarE [bacterium]|nr:ATP-dependent sacrificial sulfur transferase LarE [bacterium]HOL68122.1 ATP-dependent sacrificial sulfur transferase LarE [bacterium]HPP11153.1 ATP-dependent sacrificial sulfur transferase LarE [bacterium]
MKLELLERWLQKAESVLVAYSGGVDSSLLLKIALKTLGKENVLAVTASSPLFPAEEIARARELARRMGARHLIIRATWWRQNDFTANPPDRCYLCKRELYRHLRLLARRSKLKTVLDGANADDRSDFRPGEKARKEFHIRSPLQEIGLTKKEVRLLARELGLPVWNKASSACLASRIPYGRRITLRKLKRIEDAENYLRKFNLGEIRVRDYGCLARVETDPDDWPKLLRHRKQVLEGLKKSGYLYITLDLEGFRSGSLNAALKTKTALEISDEESRGG